jgi:hypothetical protein
MNMKFKSLRTALLAIAAIVGSFAIAPAAEGQFLSRLHPSFYGSAEWDTQDSEFYLIGMYVGVAKLGWSPYLNVNAYRLNYVDRRPPPQGGPRNLSAISPTLGLAYAGRNGGFSFGGGYTWTDFDDPGAPGAEGGGSSGPHVAFGAYRNGSGDRPWRLQFLSNYNFGAEYLWTRLRANTPIAERVRVGAEFIAQGGFEEGSESSVFKVGPTVEVAWTDNFRTGAVVGWKNSGGNRFPDGRENAAYFKLEFSFSPF